MLTVSIKVESTELVSNLLVTICPPFKFRWNIGTVEFVLLPVFLPEFSKRASYWSVNVTVEAVLVPNSDFL